VPITDSSSTGPLGSFQPEQLSMPVNGTTATAVRHTNRVAVIQPNRPPQAASIQLPSYATEGRSATLFETRSVGQTIHKGA
jgi:hypothetical protein